MADSTTPAAPSLDPRTLSPAAETGDPGPVLPGERIQSVDVLRGFALFGVVLVNGSFASGAGEGSGLASTIISWAFWNLIEGRFYTLFGILFGLGFALQFSRADARGTRLTPMYLRRLLVLFGIGALHVLLAYDGDILMSYAAVALLLLPMRRLSVRSLVIMLLMTFLLPGLLRYGLYPALGLTIPKPLDSEMVARVTTTGSFLEVARLRVDQWLFWLTRWWYGVLPNNLRLFLLGVIVWRTGLLQTVSARPALLRRGLLAGLLAAALAAGANALADAYVTAPRGGSLLYMTMRQVLGNFVTWPVTLVYAALLLMALNRGRGQTALTLLGPAGRMALTNYLLASVLFSLLFNGYGLGWYAKLDGPVVFTVPISIFVAQMFMSRWWLARYRFGPAEWVWRSLTYGHRQAMRLAPR